MPLPTTPAQPFTFQEKQNNNCKIRLKTINYQGKEERIQKNILYINKDEKKNTQTPHSSVDLIVD